MRLAGIRYLADSEELLVVLRRALQHGAHTHALAESVDGTIGSNVRGHGNGTIWCAPSGRNVIVRRDDAALTALRIDLAHGPFGTHEHSVAPCPKGALVPGRPESLERRGVIGKREVSDRNRPGKPRPNVRYVARARNRLAFQG